MYENDGYYRAYVMRQYMDSIGTATGFPNIYYLLILGQNLSWKGFPKINVDDRFCLICLRTCELRRFPNEKLHICKELLLVSCSTIFSW